VRGLLLLSPGPRGSDSNAYLATTNPNPTPVHRSKTADQIIKRVERGRVTRDAITN